MGSTPTDIDINDETESNSHLEFIQWQVRSNGVYVPSGKSVKHIPPGNYWTGHSDDFGLFLQHRGIISDGIIEMPDSASEKVLAVMHKFWQSKDRYDKFGLLFKRGVLLHGPPGSGKSVTVRQLSQQVIELGGIVVHCDHPGMLTNLLMAVRAIEPSRPIIVIYEDIDEIIRQHSEHSILALLDGETQIANIVHIATTNYPEKLGARIINRPSRFDERVFVGMPTAAQREHYLRHLAPDSDIDTWVADTDGFSIAHLRELIAAVYCLEADYVTTLDRLKEMNDRPEPVEGFNQPEAAIGFGSRPRQRR